MLARIAADANVALVERIAIAALLLLAARPALQTLWLIGADLGVPR